VPSPFGAAPAHAGFSDESVLVGRVKFIVEQGKILGEQFLLGDHDMSIGRYDAATGYCPDIDLTAQDPAYVHRQHARLTFSPDGRDLAITDLGGRNGCYVNNRLLERNGTARLRMGDKIRIGRVVMRLAGAGEADKPANQR
jgi:predicted component of type VI protein secretion system